MTYPLHGKHDLKHALIEGLGAVEVVTPDAQKWYLTLVIAYTRGIISDSLTRQLCVKYEDMNIAPILDLTHPVLSVGSTYLGKVHYYLKHLPSATVEAGVAAYFGVEDYHSTGVVVDMTSEIGERIPKAPYYVKLTESLSKDGSIPPRRLCVLAKSMDEATDCLNTMKRDCPGAVIRIFDSYPKSNLPMRHDNIGIINCSRERLHYAFIKNSNVLFVRNRDKKLPLRVFHTWNGATFHELTFPLREFMGEISDESLKIAGQRLYGKHIELGAMTL